jgi:hypothetical protein
MLVFAVILTVWFSLGLSLGYHIPVPFNPLFCPGMTVMLAIRIVFDLPDEPDVAFVIGMVGFYGSLGGLVDVLRYWHRKACAVRNRNAYTDEMRGSSLVISSLRSRLTRIAWAWAATLTMCTFAIAIMASLAYATWWLGDRDFFPRPLRCLLIPGMLLAYILGTLSKLASVAVASFIVGTIGFYGIIGGIVDLLRLRSRIRKRIARKSSGSSE